MTGAKTPAIINPQLSVDSAIEINCQHDAAWKINIADMASGELLLLEYKGGANATQSCEMTFWYVIASSLVSWHNVAILGPLSGDVTMWSAEMAL